MDNVKIMNQFRKNLKKIAFGGCILQLVHIPVGIVTAAMLSSIVSHANMGRTEAVLRQSLVLLSVIICMHLLEIAGGIFFRIAKEKAVHRCRICIYQQLEATPLASLFSLNYGDTAERLHDDFDTVTGMFTSLYPDFFTGIITVIAYSAFLLTRNWQIALFLGCMTLLQILPPVIVKKFLQVNYDSCREIEAQLTNFVVSGYEGFLVIKLYNLKQWWIGELKKYHKTYMKIGASSIYTGTAESTLNELVSMVLSYGVYGVLGVLVLAGYASLDDGVQGIALAGGLFGATRTIFSMISKFGVAKTAERRLCKDFEADGDLDAGEKMRGTDVTISNVSYSYGSNMVLRHADACIRDGQTILIKGANGAGKSTLFYLMTGMVRCQEGQIAIGGAEPVRLCNGSFPRDLFYLPQEDADFGFSAREFYKMGSPENAGKAERLARELCLTEDTIADKAISTLSGGERKKVFIAYAFAVNPLVMLLDEPTNSLDESGRIRLREMIKHRKNTTVIISHDDFFDDISDENYLIAGWELKLYERQ